MYASTNDAPSYVDAGPAGAGHPAGEITTSPKSRVGARASVLAGLSAQGMANAHRSNAFTTVSVVSVGF